MPAFETHLTPNPNSIKITTDAGPFIESGMASYATPAQAKGNELAEALFAIEGIANVFMLPQFLTITKSAAADWSELYSRIDQALTLYFDANG